jgi:phosphatidylglycerol---prolipoprotein diacylglyceryl transferase
MLRELFRIPYFDVPLYSFGLMLVIGCWTAIELAKFLARRSGMNPEHFANICIIALLGGVVGARASHVLENFQQYFGKGGEGLLAAFNIREGGLTYYGGVMLATPLCIAYALRNKIPLRRGMDIIAPTLMVGLALGRVGCFLNGCCWGATCDQPWAVTFPYGSPAYESQVEEKLVAAPPPELIIDNPIDPLRDRRANADDLRKNPKLAAIARTLRSQPVHPTQLYSTLAAALVCAACVALYTLAPSPGRVFAMMMVLEGAARFTIETLRVEPPVMHVGPYGFSISMVIGVCLVIGGAILWFAFPLFGRRADPELVSTPSATPSLA